MDLPYSVHGLPYCLPILVYCIWGSAGALYEIHWAPCALRESAHAMWEDHAARASDWGLPSGLFDFNLSV
eukprot:4718355-Alexandrium_andersonii.AAC.1